MLKNSSGVRIDILPVAAKSFLLRVIKYLHFPLIAELSCMASSKSLISLLNDLFSISGFRVIIENPFIIDFVTIFASDSDRFFFRQKPKYWHAQRRDASGNVAPLHHFDQPK
jgi:hypothetical protein